MTPDESVLRYHRDMHYHFRDRTRGLKRVLASILAAYDADSANYTVAKWVGAIDAARAELCRRSTGKTP